MKICFLEFQKIKIGPIPVLKFWVHLCFYISSYGYQTCKLFLFFQPKRKCIFFLLFLTNSFCLIFAKEVSFAQIHLGKKRAGDKVDKFVKHAFFWFPRKTISKKKNWKRISDFFIFSCFYIPRVMPPSSSFSLLHRRE